MKKTVFRTCTICEANCGLRFEVDGDEVLSVGPDEDDVFSAGYICPKGAAMADIHSDPDRLRQPMKRQPDGTFKAVSWEEALTETAEQLFDLRQRHGADAVALYIGNPIIHNAGALALRAGLIRAIGSKNVSSASSQDTSPRFAASYYLYGLSISIPVPDIDRTQYLLCVGANPRVSNGSVLTAPDIRRRLAAIRDRGGKVVVVDPRRTETAREADEHVSIRPGGDAAFLLAMIQTIVSEGRHHRDAIDRMTTGWGRLAALLERFTPEAVANHVGVEPETVRRIAREFVQATMSAAYSRIGVCNGPFGTIASYATDLLNLVAGRLGAEGGSLFPRPVVDVAPILRWTKGDGHGRWRTRVRKLPETLGDVPASTLAEEIETPGNGQVSGLLTYAGNPVLSVPNGRRLDRALDRLDFMASVDLYINETTRHANIILPPASCLTEPAMDIFAMRFAVRTIARWSPAVVERRQGDRHDWEILLDLIYRLGGGPTGVGWLDRIYRIGRHVGFRWTPQASFDPLIRIGTFGDRFLPWSSGLNLKRIQKSPHGMDLGPMPTGISHGVHHRDGRMHIDGEPIIRAIEQLSVIATSTPKEDELLLIGRRELRSNNSWLHNVASLMTGRDRCWLMVHPSDAARWGLQDGQEACLESRVHRGTVPIKITEDVRPGVVSLPHGYGHASSRDWQKVAGSRPGVSANDWTDDERVETVVGQSILNGVPVRLKPATSTAPHSPRESARV